MNDQLANYGDRRMTAKEVAMALGVDDRTVRKYIAKLFPDLMQHGITTYLDERQVTTIKLEMQRNQHLERSFQATQTELERALIVQQALHLLNDQVEELKAEALENKPKIEFFYTVGNAKGLHSIQQVAKMIGWGPNKLFAELRRRKVLMQDNIPYQTYIDRGYFETKENPYSVGNSEVLNSRTYVTAKGLQWIQRILQANIPVTIDQIMEQTFSNGPAA